MSHDATRVIMATEKIVLPPNHFKQRVRNQYSDVELSIVRELVQNSVDAKATRLDIMTTEHGFDAVDDGCGMTLDQFRQFYLTLGGTKKETNSIGGFGAAKELLSYAHESWYVQSIGFYCSGSGASNPESRQDASMKSGFRIGATDETLLGDRIEDSAFALVAQSNVKIDVYVNGRKRDNGRSLRKNQLVREFDFGNLYVHKSGANLGYYEMSGYLYIRTAGLFTASEWVGGDYVWYLDVIGNPREILSENRESLKYEHKQTVSKEVTALQSNPKRMENTGTPIITVYGQALVSDTYYHHNLGEMKVNSQEDITWRKPFAVCRENSKKQIAEDGILKPSFAKALEIWDMALTLIGALSGLEKPIAGLYIGKSAVAIHAMVGRDHVIAAEPSLMKRSSFEIVETAIHEFAHYLRSGHSQEYETERMNIACKLGDSVLAIMHQVDNAKSQSARQGRYWE